MKNIFDFTDTSDDDKGGPGPSKGNSSKAFGSTKNVHGKLAKTMKDKATESAKAPGKSGCGVFPDIEDEIELSPAADDECLYVESDDDLSPLMTRENFSKINDLNSKKEKAKTPKRTSPRTAKSPKTTRVEASPLKAGVAKDLAKKTGLLRTNVKKNGPIKANNSKTINMSDVLDGRNVNKAILQNFSVEIAEEKRNRSPRVNFASPLCMIKNITPRSRRKGPTLRSKIARDNQEEQAAKVPKVAKEAKVAKENKMPKAAERKILTAVRRSTRVSKKPDFYQATVYIPDRSASASPFGTRKVDLNRSLPATLPTPKRPLTPRKRRLEHVYVRPADDPEISFKYPRVELSNKYVMAKTSDDLDDDLASLVQTRKLREPKTVTFEPKGNGANKVSPDSFTGYKPAKVKAAVAVKEVGKKKRRSGKLSRTIDMLYETKSKKTELSPKAKSTVTELVQAMEKKNGAQNAENNNTGAGPSNALVENDNVKASEKDTEKSIKRKENNRRHALKRKQFKKDLQNKDKIRELLNITL